MQINFEVFGLIILEYYNSDQIKKMRK